MPDELAFADSGPDDLVLRAMLYASGELDPAEAAAFELRLGEDQAARDALCQAVQLTSGVIGDGPAAPDPAYRSHVRQRLRQRRRQRLASSQQLAYFAHPAFWAVFGALVAIILMLIVSQLLASLETNPGPPSTPPQTAPQNSSDQMRPISWDQLAGQRQGATE